MSDNSRDRDAELGEFDAIVIGAGFAGLYAVFKFTQLGFRVQGFEKAGGVGGVWYWNRYPGARCDCESYYYSYSFSKELQQKWKWSQRYAEQPEILSYLNHVADAFDLSRRFLFDANVESMVFDEETSRWTVTTSRGTATAMFVISAAGCISAVQRPDYPGLDEFEGEVYYTGAWPHGNVEFSGKRVGIVGTGASGAQAIPIIAKTAAHLTVFQRTPNFVLPARNAPMAPDFDAWVKTHYDEIRTMCLNSPGAVPFEGSKVSALDVSPEERQRVYQKAWDLGGLRFFVDTFNDLITNKGANDTAAEFVRAHIRSVVKDPKVAELLCPRSHPIATKRPPLGDDYYATYNRSNVTLVDISASPISGFSKRTVHTTDAGYELDTLILATGFDAMTGALLRIDVRGRAGLTLKDKWREGARTYLGLGIAGFPNLFTITGPFSPSVVANMPTGVEQHVDWIAGCMNYMRERGLVFVEANEKAEEQWVTHSAEVANGTLYPQTNSWYVGANIPGKPRQFSVYLGGFSSYRERCELIAQKDYEGFSFGLSIEPRSTTVSPPS